MSKTFHNGYEGGFSYEKSGVPVDVDITEWSGEESSPSVDVTTTGDYLPATGFAYTRRWKTRRSFTGQISFPIDSGLDTADFRAGVMLKNVKLVEADGREWTFPEVYVASRPVTPGGMDDVLRTSISIESSGIYYGPEDTVPATP